MKEFLKGSFLTFSIASILLFSVFIAHYFNPVPETHSHENNKPIIIIAQSNTEAERILAILDTMSLEQINKRYKLKLK